MSLPIHVNSIDSFVFWDLVGTIYLSQQQMEILQREGIDGLGFRRKGTSGKPFTLRSITYFDSFSDANTALASYSAVVGSGLVTVTRNDIAITGFVVLGVAEAKPPEAVFNVAGSPSSECRAEVLWQLVQA